MIKVTSTVKLNAPQINKLNDAAVQALEMTAEALHTEIVQARVVPRMDGALQGEAFFVDKSESKNGKVSLVHSTPYARRLYYHPEYKFNKGPWEETIEHKDGTVSHVKHDGNPNAKGKWFEDWEPGGKYSYFAVDTFKRLYRRLADL